MSKKLLLLVFIFSFGLASAQVIVLDPGHGYCNDCTQNCTSNVRSDTEILTALAVGQKLDVLLQSCPSITTHFTRSTNNCGDFPSLSQRASMSNSWGADRFLSIHCNAGGGTGTETFWCDNSASSNIECQTYSEEIQDQMVLYGQWNDRRVVEDDSYLGFHLGVLSPTNAVGTLSEIGFVDSADEVKLLDDNWRNNFAQAYYVALQNNLGYSCSTTPINDNCSASSQLTSDTICNSVSGSVNNATTDGIGQATCDAFSGTALEAGVFYNFTAIQNEHTITVTPTATSTLDAVVSIYSGPDCNNLTEIDCLDPAGSGQVVITNSNLNIGENYWIRIYDYGSVAPSNGDFSICVTHGAPENDLCNNSISINSELTCNNTRGTVNNATSDGLGAGSCDAFSGTPLEAGVFYNFNAISNEHTVTVTPTATSTLDAVVVIYTGSDCNNLTEFDCLDAPGTGTVTITNSTYTPGQNYWVRVYDYGSVGPSDGSFDICVTHSGEPDIVIQSLYTIPANPEVGQQVDLYVDVRNIGLAAADSFTIDYRIDGGSIGSDSVTNLPAGATQSEFLDNYIFGSPATYNYCVFMSAPTGEINTANNSFCINVDVTSATQVSANINAMLQGPLLNAPGNLMRDDLRMNGSIPTTSPYADGLTCDSSVFNITGNDAIVDWVWLELRDENDNTNILADRSALIQADGDIVDVDGSSSVSFNASSGNYFIVVNHKNHLGIMTQNTIALSGTPVNISFSDGAETTFGSNALSTVGIPLGLYALWTGDTNGDNTIRFTGTNNDSNSIKDTILAAPGNILGLVTYNYLGYHNTDINLDGGARFSGTNNDTNYLKDNIIGHPGNILNLTTYIIQEQLP